MSRPACAGAAVHLHQVLHYATRVAPLAACTPGTSGRCTPASLLCACQPPRLPACLHDPALMAGPGPLPFPQVKWTRNSRTDKGVHSLATVVALRVLLPGDERWVLGEVDLRLALRAAG